MGKFRKPAHRPSLGADWESFLRRHLERQANTPVPTPIQPNDISPNSNAGHSENVNDQNSPGRSMSSQTEPQEPKNDATTTATSANPLSCRFSSLNQQPMSRNNSPPPENDENYM